RPATAAKELRTARPARLPPVHGRPLQPGEGFNMVPLKTWRFLLAVSLAVALAPPVLRGEDAKAKTADAWPISYYKPVRPIFQAHCQGCHQPAKARGDYVMTAFDKLLAGGESGTPAIVPRQPDKSQLVELITPKDGKAEMPQGKKPLAEAEID